MGCPSGENTAPIAKFDVSVVSSKGFSKFGNAKIASFDCNVLQ